MRDGTRADGTGEKTGLEGWVVFPRSCEHSAGQVHGDPTLLPLLRLTPPLRSHPQATILPASSQVQSP